MKKIILGMSIFFIGVFSVFCQELSLSVEEIMSRYDSNAAYNTAYMKATLSVKDKFGTNENEFESYRRKNGDTLIIITSGADSGQKILRLENSVYLYYPDAEEIIRLQGSALKDSVMGSDFTYEDLTGEEGILDSYNGELLGTETVDGAECYHVMLTAKTKKQLYQKQEKFIDKKTFAEKKCIVYSASGKAMSESTMSKINKIGKYNIFMEGTMQNLLKKSSVTKMKITEIKLDEPILESKFSRDELSW